MTTLDNDAPRAKEQPAQAPAAAKPVSFAIERGLSVRGVVALALVSGLLARGVAPALPGLAVGMEGFILLAARVAAVLSLVTVAGALAANARLSARLFGDSSLDPAYRMLVIPASMCVAVLGVAAVFQSLGAELGLVLAFAASGAVLVASPLLLRRRETRAAGLMLALTGAAGLLHVLGRAIALHAADEANVTGFLLAQWTETLATLIDVAALALVGAYMARRAPKRRRWLLAGCAALLLGFAFAATKGVEPASPWWLVLSGRVLEQFLRNPDPFLPQVLRYAIESIGFFLTIVALFARSSGAFGTLFAACLVGRAAADIPLPALILLLAALLAPEALAAKTAPAQLSSR